MVPFTASSHRVLPQRILGCPSSPDPEFTPEAAGPERLRTVVHLSRQSCSPGFHCGHRGAPPVRRVPASRSRAAHRPFRPGGSSQKPCERNSLICSGARALFPSGLGVCRSCAQQSPRNDRLTNHPGARVHVLLIRPIALSHHPEETGLQRHHRREAGFRELLASAPARGSFGNTVLQFFEKRVPMPTAPLQSGSVPGARPRRSSSSNCAPRRLTTRCRHAGETRGV